MHFSVLRDIVISLACHSWKSKELPFSRASRSLACAVDDLVLLPSPQVSLGWVSGEPSNDAWALNTKRWTSQSFQSCALHPKRRSTPYDKTTPRNARSKRRVSSVWDQLGLPVYDYMYERENVLDWRCLVEIPTRVDVYIIVLFITRHESSGMISTRWDIPRMGNGLDKHDNLSLLLNCLQSFCYQPLYIFLVISDLPTIGKRDWPTLPPSYKSSTK